MIPVKVDELTKGDVIRFVEEGRSYAVENVQIHSYEHSLRHVEFGSRGPGGVTMPAMSEVFAEKMVRKVEVPCVVHRENVKMLWNMAAGGTPRAVLCGDCDEKVTAEVMARMAEEKGEVNDV